jgi:TatD DNase family protein
MNLIDSHCHLIDKKFADIESVFKRATMAGVEKMIMPTGNLTDAIKAIQLAKEFKQFAMVGIHPEDIDTVVNIEAVIAEERSIIANGGSCVVGIGEIGLDFYFDKEKKSKEKQIEIFTKQMQLAVELKLPVVIHMREAEDEMLKVLEELSEVPTGQFHCFDGSEPFLKYVLEKGFYVSFAGNITFKSAGNLRELIKLVSLNKLLLETDSPYLAPEPLRGTVNEPANVKIIAEFIAGELGITPDLLAETTTKNAKCLYSLDI